jgi:hypothetical protein
MSVLKQLSDTDREAICHMIRRDAHTDLAIALEAEKRLGSEISPTEAGKCAVVRRYREGAQYAEWLKRWHAERSAMEAALSEQRRRYDMLSNLVENGSGEGFEGVGKFLQARLLELAARSTDEDLIESFGANGWVKNLMMAVQREQKIDLARKLADKAAEAEQVAGSTTLDAAERARRMREIFGRDEA